MFLFFSICLISSLKEIQVKKIIPHRELNQGPLTSESTLQNRPNPSFYRDQLKAHPNLCMTLVIETFDVIALDRNDPADTSGMIHRLQIDQEYLLRR